MAISDSENQDEHRSEKEPEKVVSQAASTQNQPVNDGVVDDQQMIPAQKGRIPGKKGGKTGAVEELRIKGRLVQQEIGGVTKVELDLEVEAHLNRKVKGDVTIGLI
ncbi:hypothetical protein B7463_g5818, partial [Scytalidium lignicola]